MEPLEIITHGNGAILVDLFNAIARIRSGNFINSVFIVMMFSGYALSIIQNIAIFNAREIAKWTIAWTLLFGLAYQPTAEIFISDRIVGGQVKVDNVPIGLAVFASITSQMGANLAEIFEDQLGIPEESVTRYTQTGTLMSSKMALAASETQIMAPHLERSFRNFAFQCVMYDVRIGAKYTMDDLLYENDVWGLIKNNTSVLRMFEYYGPKGGREILTCREGAIKLDEDLNKEACNHEKILTWRFWGNHKDSEKPFHQKYSAYFNDAIKNYLPASHELLVHMSGKTTEILKKHMVMNAVRESAIKNAQMLDVGAGAQGYAIARAKLQQQNTFQLLGAMAGNGVQYLMGLFEALFYGSFILILLIAIMPGCQKVLLSYLGSLVWVQSWPTIYTIINFFMTANTIAANNAAASYVGSDTQGIGWNLFTSPAIIQANLDQAALAGFYSLSVPFIAIAIVKGTGSFVHLAGHLSSISQGAASQAGEELTTGNYGVENVQYLNTSANSLNANHWDSAASYRARNASFEMDTGSQMRVSGDGSAMLDQTQGMSQLLSNLHLGESYSQRRSEVVQDLESVYQQSGKTYIDSISSTLASASQAMKAGGINISDGEHYSQSEQTGRMSSIQKFDQLSDKLAAQMGWSKDQARSMMLAGSASVGKSGEIKLPKKLGEKILGVGVEGRAGAGYNHSWNNRDAREMVLDFIHSENATETIDQAIRATQDIHSNRSTDHQDRYTEDLSTNLSKMKHYENQFQTARQKLHSFQHSQEVSEGQSGNIEHNLNQSFVDWAKDQIGSDGNTLGIEGVDAMLRNTDLAQGYTSRFLDERIHKMRKEYGIDNAMPVGEYYQDLMRDFTDREKVESQYQKNKAEVLTQASQQGISPSTGSQLHEASKATFEKITSENNQAMASQKESIRAGRARVLRKVAKKINKAKSYKDPETIS